MNKFIQLMLLLIGCVYLVSCAQEGKFPGKEETVTFTLNIGTEQSSASISRNTTTGSTVLPYEGIRTLRVLVISDHQDPKQRKILYNKKRSIDSSPNPTEAKLSASLTLENIPVGMASIYLIANEESIGTEYTDDILMSSDYIEDSKLLLLDEEWKHFPKTYNDIATYGLPMSGKREGIDIQSEMSSVDIYLERAVVKLGLTIENATSDNLTLNWVEFGEFISDRVFMYPTISLDIPSHTLYKNLRYPKEINTSLNQELPVGGKTEWQNVYIYPNFAYKDPTGIYPYTLSLGTDKKTYNPSQFAEGMNSMRRNTYIDITARITASATISIAYQYVPWEDITIDVPPFN